MVSAHPRSRQNQSDERQGGDAIRDRSTFPLHADDARHATRPVLRYRTSPVRLEPHCLVVRPLWVGGNAHCDRYA